MRLSVSFTDLAARCSQRPAWLWLVNLAALGTIVLWMLTDASGGASWNRGVHFLAGTWSTFRTQSGGANAAYHGSFLLPLLVGTGAISLGAGWLLLFFGPRKYRHLIAWLATVGLTSLWLGLATNAQELIWWGYRFRLQGALPHYELASRSLRANWPDADGDRRTVGPYLAYPIAGPKTLLLLETPEFSPGTHVSSVERSDAGAIRFELAGREQGVWLEWHPADDSPTSFVGGLEDSHKLEKFSALGRCWYVVRYHEP